MNFWKRCDRALKYLSWTILLAEVAYVAVRLCLPPERVSSIDGYAAWMMPALLAGAVGYITNWLALWYLFKPYSPRLCGMIHGIIPRQKGRMAVSMGRMVGTRLLDPNALVAEMQREILDFMDDPRRTAAFRDWIQKFLLDHESRIVEFVVPYVEGQVMELLDNVATDETWGKIWDEGILPRLRREQTRAFVVGKFVDVLKDNAAGVIDGIRAELDTFLRSRLRNKIPSERIADAIADYVMENFADAQGMRERLGDWLSKPETQHMLRDKMLECSDQIAAWMKDDEGRAAMSGIVRELKVRGKRFLAVYIREKFPELVGKAFVSEALRDRLEHVAIPQACGWLVALIGERKQSIMDKLRLEERVASAVNGMNMAELHQMMNDFMAENFCAVQVLGFFLGVLVGALQLLAKFA